MNHFLVDYTALYINWANTFLFIIPGTLPTVDLPKKSLNQGNYFFLMQF